MEGYGYLRDLAIILIAAKLMGVIARKFHFPEVVGEILAGLLIGPAVLGIVQGSDFISEIAEIGVIMLMFEAGIGTDMDKLRSTGLKAMLIASGGVLVPLAAGTFLFMAFYGFGPVGSEQFLKGLFIGTIMTATSVSITVKALQEMGKLNGIIGTTITSAAIIDDVIGIVVLTLVIGLRDTQTNALIVILRVALFFAFALVAGFLIFHVFKWLDRRNPHTRRVPISALVYCLAMAYVANKYFGIADITGAYVAGVTLSGLNDAGYIERRVDISAYMVFEPVFFAGIGLKVSFGTMGPRLLLFSIAFVAVAMVTKIIGCGLVALATGYDRHDSLKIGTGMMTRGEVALVTSQKGLTAGMLTADFFTPVILLILFSSILTPVILKGVYSKYPRDDAQF